MTETRKISIRNWFITLGILATFIFAIYWVASFFFMFGTNMCYSGAIDELREISTSVINSNDPKKKEMYTEMVKHLPIYGYETDCEELSNSIKKIHEKL